MLQYLTFDEWLAENLSKIEIKWNAIKDEYGDAGPLLSSYKEQCYREYVDDVDFTYIEDSLELN